ncbi:MAG: hypothetical protein AAF934_00360 [Bacteroidota bacterium]
MKININEHMVALSAAEMVKIVTGGVVPKPEKTTNLKPKDHDKKDMDSKGGDLPERAA